MTVFLAAGVFSILFEITSKVERLSEFIVALVASIAFLAISVLPTIGAWCARVETDIAGIRVYDERGRLVFNALWAWVKRYQRMADLRWKLETADAEVWLPEVENKEELQIEILRHVPSVALQHATRPGKWPTHYTQPLILRARRGRDVGLLAAGPLLLLLVLVCFGSNMASMSRFWLLLYLFTATGLAWIANDVTQRCMRAIRRLRRERVQIDDTVIRYDDGSGPIEIPWEEVRFLVGPGMDGSEANLLVMSKDRIIAIEHGFPEFGHVAALAVAKAPETAAIFP